MIHLRLIVPHSSAPEVIGWLRAEPAVAHLVHLPDASIEPAGDLVLCDVVREGANEVIEGLQDRGVHHDGAISIDSGVAVVSDAAATADRLTPGAAGDAMIWEQIEDRARDESGTTVSYLTFMGVAAVIAAVGILLDSPVLIVGAMAVGPEYGPIAAACVALARFRLAPARRAGLTLLAGFGVAALTALVATVIFRLTSIAPDAYTVTSRELTAFISHPGALAVVVAVLAGVAGMLSLTEDRAGALVGVLVSVTTLPAVANVGVAAAYQQWHELGGAAAQLTVNVAGLVVAGVLTLLVQHRFTTPSRGSRSRVPTTGLMPPTSPTSPKPR